MRHRTRIVLTVLAALAMMWVYWGCDRLEGDKTPNQLPIVSFINVPVDSTVFSYAPVVRWTGYDPDGMIVAYQYHDDSTTAALNAYNAGDDALRAYINSLPDNAWTTTTATSDTIYLRRAESDSITQHIFMIRCLDDLGGYSPVKVRTFFRTNNPPNPPSVKWALDATLLDDQLDYQPVYNVPDTLFWSDTTTLTYPGIGFLWQGTDPDSRELNIIPLTFSWVLVCDRASGAVDTMPHPVYDDSGMVVGFASGWSPWSSSTQVTFSGWFADSQWCLANRGGYFNLDGSYRFLVKVRDDGLTEASAMAMAHFAAVNPTFEKQLLIVDWNRNTSTYDNLGGRPKQDIIDFYNGILEESFNLADDIRQYAYPFLMPDPIAYDPNQIEWFTDADLNNLQGTPYDYIRHFKWVWIIYDNPLSLSPNEITSTVYPQLKTLMKYMDVGGQVMISGRKIFYSAFGMPTNPNYVVDPGPRNIADNFVRDYLGISEITAKGRHPGQNNPADFAGAVSNDIYEPAFEVDTALIRQMRWITSRPTYLPEIDYFGRSTGRSGYDYSATVFNYQSSSSLAEYDTTNVDCQVMLATPSQATLRPHDDSKPLLRISRIYNRTRNVYGELIRFWQPVADQWRILVSTPVSAGAWQDSDILEVDYAFIPIETSHDEPVATNFNRIEGVLTIDFQTGGILFQGVTRYRSSLVAFPLSFMKNDRLEPITGIPGFTGEYHPVAKMLAAQILFFNGPRTQAFGQGQ